MRNKLIPVIISGGVGSRLWPLSREAHPKPFIKLDDGESLIQKTYQRLLALPNVEEVVTVTNRNLFFHTKDEYAETGKQNIPHTFLLEPFGRNSTAAIALAAHYARRQYGDNATLLVLPADHLIKDCNAFVEAVKQAVALSSQERLVTFGIQADSPQTGFGYIEADGFEVKRFVEKPDLNTAKQYVASGNFFWNSGIFCMEALTFLNELDKFYAEIAEQTLAAFNNASYSQGPMWQQYEIPSKLFQPVRDISVDCAVFEQSKRVAIVPCDMGWSDIGSWTEFGLLHPVDEAGNHVAGNVMLEDVQNCTIHGESRLVAALGIDNLVIADTADALLVADKTRTQDVRNIVKKLKQRDDSTYKLFPTVHRPWGTYTTLLESAGFKLKQIEVKPGAALSLQSHNHRSEHWVIVQGTAKVTNGDKILTLEQNQSTYIPIGNKHRLENPGQQSLILIEVQCGQYLGEDDIIRYEDTYGRVACPV